MLGSLPAHISPLNTGYGGTAVLHYWRITPCEHPGGLLAPACPFTHIGQGIFQNVRTYESYVGNRAPYAPAAFPERTNVRIVRWKSGHRTLDSNPEKCPAGVPFSGRCKNDPKPFGPLAQLPVKFSCPLELRRHNPSVMSSQSVIKVLFLPISPWYRAGHILRSVAKLGNAQ